MYETLLEELRATGISFAAGGWSVAPGTDHGILRLDGGAATVWADDQIQEQALSGSVHVFTADDGHSQMQSVQAAMTRAGIRWRLAYIQYEERSRLTHYTWNIELEAA